MASVRRCATKDCVRTPTWGAFNGTLQYALCGPCKNKIKPKRLREQTLRFVRIA